MDNDLSAPARSGHVLDCNRAERCCAESALQTVFEAHLPASRILDEAPHAVKTLPEEDHLIAILLIYHDCIAGLVASRRARMAGQVALIMTEKKSLISALQSRPRLGRS